MRELHVVAGLLRRGDELLMVRQAGMEAFAESLTAVQRRKLDTAIDALMEREDIAEAFAVLKEVGSR